MSVDVLRSKTVADVFRRVKRTFGDEAGVQITNSDIIDWINDGQVEICERQKITKIKMSADVSADSGWFIISLAEMISIEDVQFEGKPLPYLPLEEASSTIMQTDPYKVSGDTPFALQGILDGQPKKKGDPQFWTIDTAPLFDFKESSPAQPILQIPDTAQGISAIYLWPVPDRDVKRGLTITFVRMPRSVGAESDQLEIPDKFFNALISYVLTRAYELDEDHDSATIKSQEFENAMLGYITESEDEQMRTYPKTTYYNEGW